MTLQYFQASLLSVKTPTMSTTEKTTLRIIPNGAHFAVVEKANRNFVVRRFPVSAVLLVFHTVFLFFKWVQNTKILTQEKP